MIAPHASEKVISIARGRGFRAAAIEEDTMPVSRAYIAPFASTDTDQYQAFTDIANFVDALESAIGVRVGAGATAPTAPASASWAITATQGHFLIQIANPAQSGQTAPVQHQIASAVNAGFDANASTTTYTLGVGETSRDLVDPGVTKYWRLRSRYPGSAWNNWSLYATASGVVALTSGSLKTS